jgi:glycosyltransferase involved in cell wall biosynthesis
MPKKTINTIHDLGFERDNKIYRKDEIGPENKISKIFFNYFIKIFTLGKYSANSMDHLKWSVNFALKKAKKIITVSNFSKNEIKDFYGGQEDKVDVVYNGYNDNLYKKINDPKLVDKVLKKYGINSSYFLYIGRIEKKKNIALLIEAFANLKESDRQIEENLVLIGNAGFGYDEVEYLINEFNLSSSVFMLGWVEEEDLPYFYSGATAFVFPSKYEGFGIPILQAMACGTPVVISDIPPLREIAQEAACYFNPCDISSMAQALKKIVNDDNLRVQLISEAQNRVKFFSWEKCAKDTLKIIKAL